MKSFFVDKQALSEYNLVENKQFYCQMFVATRYATETRSSSNI